MNNFKLTGDGASFYTTVILNNELVEVSFDLNNKTKDDIRWDKVEQIIEHIKFNHDDLMLLAEKFLLFFCKESKWYTEVEVHEIKKFNLAYIELDSFFISYPYHSLFAFTYNFNFDWSFDFSIDLYSSFEVSFINTLVSEVRRVQN